MPFAIVGVFVPGLPSTEFVLAASYLFARWGQITGTPENCRRLLEDEEAILVFPEGAKGISKPFTQRYQLQEFGNGFLRLALETGAPIVPIAVVGAEEQAPAGDVLNSRRTVKDSHWRETTAHLGVRFDPAYRGPGCKVRDVIAGSPALVAGILIIRFGRFTHCQRRLASDRVFAVSCARYGLTSKLT